MIGAGAWVSSRKSGETLVPGVAREKAIVGSRTGCPTFRDFRKVGTTGLDFLLTTAPHLSLRAGADFSGRP